MSKITFGNIHESLHKARKTMGISQETLARALNVEQASVSMYENGKRGIPLELLDKWLDYLQFDWSFTPSEEKPVVPKEKSNKDLERFNELKKMRNEILREMHSLFAEMLIDWPLTNYREFISDIPNMVMYPDFRTYDVTLLETVMYRMGSQAVMIQYRPEEVVAFWDQAREHLMTEAEFRAEVKSWSHSEYEMRKCLLLYRDQDLMEDRVVYYSIGEACRGFYVEDLSRMSEIHRNYTELWEEMTYRNKAFSDLTSDWFAIFSEMGEIHKRNRLANGMNDPKFVWFTREDYDEVENINAV